jgi:hypothetical protein
MRELLLAFGLFNCQWHLYFSAGYEAAAFRTQAIALSKEFPRSSFTRFTALKERRCDTTWGCCI